MNDKGFINKLESFTDALGDLVDILKKKSEKSSDTVFETMDDFPNKINDIAKELSEIKKDVSDLKSTTNDIKKAVEDIKKDDGNDTGGVFFGKISNIKNKSLKEGIGIIGLMAGSILAMGLAFKVVGDVDFTSVIGLSIAISVMSVSFIEVVERMKKSKVGNKDMYNYMKMIPILTGSILLAGVVFNSIPTLSIGQMLTIGLLSITLGISTYIMSKTIKNVDGGDIKKYLLLPVILPAIATGIMVSSWLFKLTSTLNEKKLESIAVVSLSIGMSLYLMGKTIKYVKENDVKKYLLLPVILPSIALGLVLSSWAFSLVNTNFDFWKIVSLSAAVGLMSLTMMPTLFVISKYKISKESLGKSILTMVALSVLIGTIGLILDRFDGSYDENKVPGFMWSLKVGLSLMVFSIPLYFLGKMNLEQLGIGALGVIAVSAAIMISSLILGLGTYKDYPNVDWSLGVGLSLLTFGLSAIVLGAIIMESGGLIGAAAIVTGLLAVIALSATIVLVDTILSQGSWNNYPSYDWSSGVGLSLLTFGLSAIVLGGIMVATLGIGAVAIAGGMYAVSKLADLMVDVSLKLNKGKWSNYPSYDWSRGVSESLVGFTLAIEKQPGFFSIGKSISGSKDYILDLVDLVVNVNSKFNKWVTNGYPNSDWSEGIVNFIELFSNIDYTNVDIDYKSLEDISNGMVVIAKSLSDTIWGSISDKNYPSKEWSESVSISLLSFSSVLNSLNNMNLKSKDFGKEGIQIIDGLREISIRMSSKDFEPPNKNLVKWSKDASTVFDSILKIDKLVKKNKIWKNSKDINKFNLKMYLLISNLSRMSLKLKGVKFSKLENIGDWSKGIKTAIENIVPTLGEIHEGDFNRFTIGTLESIFETILLINNNLRGFNGNKTPSEEWSKNISSLIDNLVPALEKIHTGVFVGHSIDTLKNIMEAVVEIDKGFNNKLNGLENLKDWSKSLRMTIDILVGIPNDIDGFSNNFISSLNKISNVKINLDMFDKLILKLNKLSDSLNNIHIDNKVIDMIESINKLNSLDSNLSINVSDITDSINKLNLSIDNKLSLNILDITNSINTLMDNFSKIDFDPNNNLKRLSNGITLLSNVDVNNLELLINKLSDNKEEIKDLLNVTNNNEEEEKEIKIVTIDNASNEKNELKENISELSTLLNDIKGLITEIRDDVDLKNKSGIPYMINNGN